MPSKWAGSYGATGPTGALRTNAPESGAGSSSPSAVAARQRLELQYGPDEPAPYTATWDALYEEEDPATDRTSGTVTLTLQDGAGLALVPVPGSLVEVYVGRQRWVRGKQWSLSGSVVSFVEGHHPVGDEVVQVVLTPSN